MKFRGGYIVFFIVFALTRKVLISIIEMFFGRMYLHTVLVFLRIFLFADYLNRLNPTLKVSFRLGFTYASHVLLCESKRKAKFIAHITFCSYVFQ